LPRNSTSAPLSTICSTKSSFVSMGNLSLRSLTSLVRSGYATGLNSIIAAPRFARSVHAPRIIGRQSCRRRSSSQDTTSNPATGRISAGRRSYIFIRHKAPIRRRRGVRRRRVEEQRGRQIGAIGDLVPTLATPSGRRNRKGETHTAKVACHRPTAGGDWACAALRRGGVGFS